VPERGEVVVRVHPDDAAAAADADVPELSARGIRIVADPSIEPGGCVLDVGDCRIDAQLGAAAARMRAALGVDA
jgi:flagellar assembly protein FliH